jgi:hypothetical protein
MTDELEFHPLANLFPLLDGAEFDDLVADVKANGQIEPITILDGKILDGRNRYRACVAAGITPRLAEHSGGDPLAFGSKNLRLPRTSASRPRCSANVTRLSCASLNRRCRNSQLPPAKACAGVPAQCRHTALYRLDLFIVCRCAGLRGNGWRLKKTGSIG